MKCAHWAHLQTLFCGGEAKKAKKAAPLKGLPGELPFPVEVHCPQQIDSTLSISPDKLIFVFVCKYICSVTSSYLCYTQVNIFVLWRFSCKIFNCSCTAWGADGCKLFMIVFIIGMMMMMMIIITIMMIMMIMMIIHSEDGHHHQYCTLLGRWLLQD